MDIFLLLIVWILNGILAVLFLARWKPGIFKNDTSFVAFLIFAGATGLVVISAVQLASERPQISQWLTDYGNKHSKS